MGKLKLSNTKRNKYKECPRRYDFHYNKKFRNKHMGSPLFFGVAIDEALNVLLLQKKKNLTDEEKELIKETPVEVFLKFMGKVNHNDEIVDIKHSDLSQYSKADFDHTMLTDEDLELIGQDLTFCKAHIEWYHSQKKAKGELTEEDTKLFGLINWCSLKGKGLMMIAEYTLSIMPQIHEVFSIQEIVTLPNENGDEITGIIDFTASFVDDPSTIYVVDNKTASQAYKDKDLEESDQLHLYAYYKELTNIAYIVLGKTIRKKKEPRVKIDILKGETDQDFTDALLEDYELVLADIRAEKFEPCYKSKCMFWFKPCEYYSICHHEKFDEDKLVAMKKEEK
jgi:hypothetical protein